jgi:hypothetical protein
MEVSSLLDDSEFEDANFAIDSAVRMECDRRIEPMNRVLAIQVY